ncbi:MAG: hypothetical protein ACR2GX_09605 [Candidatus Dormibacteria bacterium]
MSRSSRPGDQVLVRVRRPFEERRRVLVVRFAVPRVLTVRLGAVPAVVPPVRREAARDRGGAAGRGGASLAR